MDLPDTQTQEEYLSSQEETLQPVKPWGRLYSCLPTLSSVDLYESAYTFGRAPSCSIIVDSEHIPTILNVSKEHFILEKKDDIVYVIDTSKNGTFINAEKVGKNNKIIVNNDDLIAVGHPNSKIYHFCLLNPQESFEYPSEMRGKYLISTKLGNGAFGEVRLCYHIKTSQKFAVKKINKPRSSLYSSGGFNLTSERVKTEVTILQKISYPFIINLIDFHDTLNHVFLILEYMQGGELTKRMISQAPFPEPEVKHVFVQILLAVNHLHDMGITHRDIKPENILMASSDSYPTIKISDFGLSKILDEISYMNTICGTKTYVAPEVLRGLRSYDRRADVWSMGVVLAFMLTKIHPFMARTGEEVAKKVLTGRANFDAKNWRDISTEAKEVVRRTLVVDPTKRVRTHEIFDLDWIKKDKKAMQIVRSMEEDSFESSDLELEVKQARFDSV